jgi:hypothetical protein
MERVGTVGFMRLLLFLLPCFLTAEAVHTLTTKLYLLEMVQIYPTFNSP